MESAQTRSCLTQARGALLLVPLGRPRSAKSQLARACAVGSVTGAHARHPRAHGERATGPGHLPQRRTVQRGRVPNPGHPSHRHEVHPSGRPFAAPLARKASSQERALWHLRRGPSPTPPRRRKTGSVPRPPTPRTGSWGRVSAPPRTPLTEARGALPRSPFAPLPERKSSSQESAL